MTSDADSRVILANSIDMLAQAIDKLAEAQSSPGGAPANGSVPPTGTTPSGPPGAPPGADDTKTKMSKKVYAICAQQSGGKPSGEWDIGAIGKRVTGRDIGPDSRAWSLDDLKAVLDKFSEWGF